MAKVRGVLGLLGLLGLAPTQREIRKGWEVVAGARVRRPEPRKRALDYLRGLLSPDVAVPEEGVLTLPSLG